MSTYHSPTKLDAWCLAPTWCSIQQGVPHPPLRTMLATTPSLPVESFRLPENEFATLQPISPRGSTSTWCQVLPRLHFDQRWRCSESLATCPRRESNQTFQRAL